MRYQPIVIILLLVLCFVISDNFFYNIVNARTVDDQKLPVNVTFYPPPLVDPSKAVNDSTAFLNQYYDVEQNKKSSPLAITDTYIQSWYGTSIDKNVNGMGMVYAMQEIQPTFTFPSTSSDNFQLFAPSMRGPNTCPLEAYMIYVRYGNSPMYISFGIWDHTRYRRSRSCIHKNRRLYVFK